MPVLTRSNRREASAVATMRGIRVPAAPAPLRKVMPSCCCHEMTTRPELADVVMTNAWSDPSDSSSDEAAPPHAASFPVSRSVPVLASSKEAAPLMMNSNKEITRPELAEDMDTGSWSPPSDSSSDEAAPLRAASFPISRPVPVLASPQSTRSSEEAAPIKVMMLNSAHKEITRPELAKDMDTGSSSAPSTPPSGSSSDEAASASFPVNRPVPALASPSQLMRKMRGRAPAPAPTKVTSHFDEMTKLELAEVVMETGSCSAPSTPSNESASPHAVIFPVYSPVPAPSTWPSQPRRTMQHALLPQQMQSSVPRVAEVRKVWNYNFAEEVALIDSLLGRFRYVAVDTEFPGTVYRPESPVYMLTTEQRYALLRANVDELHLIQLGVTLFNDDGDSGVAAVTWEFNFSEFDVRHHRHAPESIAMLRAIGVDFERTRRAGVRAAALGPRLRKWLRAGLGRAGVVTFSGGYDLAYVVKLMFGSGYRLPATAAEFEAVATSIFGRQRKLFDVKEMARSCPGDLRGGLDHIAAKLNVPRAVGEAHQAGSDSLLACHTFMTMKERYFYDDDRLNRVAGMVTEIRTRSGVDILPCI